MVPKQTTSVYNETSITDSKEYKEKYNEANKLV